MPEYIYENPDTGEQVTVLQSIHEEHVYEIKGVQYNRVYTIPNASIDTKIDPFSAKEFREKAKASTVGDLWDQSAEASHRRTEKAGEDPIKKKFFEDYAKSRKGAKHPQDPSSKSDSVTQNFDIG
jgi:predicted nucleic acid-binding Zn ribbon protein